MFNSEFFGLKLGVIDMRAHLAKLIGPALLVSLVCIGAAGPARAEQVRWPSATALPKLPPPPTPGPAMLERAPSAVAFVESEKKRKAASVCKEGLTCVVCLAACDRTPPVVIQSIQPQPLGVIEQASNENNSDGVADNAPRYARQNWAGITCGSEGGCSVSGVTAPKASSSIDVRMTVFSPFMSSDGSTSRYIDR